MRTRSVLQPFVISLFVLAASSVSAQVVGSEQSTLLTAYVTEQATLALPTRAASVSLPTGRIVSGSVGVKSHLGSGDARNLRVTWSWLQQKPTALTSFATYRNASLPTSGKIEVGTTLPLPKDADADPKEISVKVESFEF